MIIAGAGGAAHLPGMMAAMTVLPVFGVPVESNALSGLNSLYSIVQMPPGVPVGTLAIGRAGAINAALIAASVLALSDAALAARLEAWRARQTAAVAEAPARGRRVSGSASHYLRPGRDHRHIGRRSTRPDAGDGRGAARLRCHVLCPEPASPAFDVVRRVTEADYADKAALDRFADEVDVITYEFENVPAETAAFLAARKPVLPDPRVLAITQDRLAEKNFVAGLGIAVAPFAAVSSPTELATALAALGYPAVLKTRRFGYDGKGQAMLQAGDDPAAAWHAIGAQPAIWKSSFNSSVKSPSSRRAAMTAGSNASKLPRTSTAIIY